MDSGPDTDLPQAAQALVDMAEELGAVGQAVRTRRALERLRDNRINVVVFGEYKRGKSTLINALLGRKVLPSGVLPLTGVSTLITSGDPEQVLVELDGGEQWHPLDALPRFVSEKQNPENRLQVRSVEVHLNAEILFDGVQIVDTPGFGSTHLHNTRDAAAYLPFADLAILVLGASPPLGERELEFLRSAKGFASKMLFVQNKVDQLSESDLREAMEFNASIVAAEMQQDSVEIVPVSALAALQDGESGTGPDRKRSHIERLEARIREAAIRNREELMAGSVRSAGLALAETLSGLLDLQDQLSRMEFEDLESRCRAFEAELAKVRQSKDDALDNVRTTVRKRMAELLESDLELFKAKVLPELLKQVSEGIKSSATPTSAVEFVNAWFPTTLTAAFEGWMGQEGERLKEALRTKLEPHREFVVSVLARISAAVSNLFDVDLPSPLLEAEVPIESRFEFRPWDMKLEVGAGQRAIRRLARNRGWLERKAAEMIWQALEMHSGRLRYDTMNRLERALDTFSEDLDHAFSSLVSSIEFAVARVRSMRNLRAGEIESAEQERAALRSRLRYATKALEAGALLASTPDEKDR